MEKEPSPAGFEAAILLWLQLTQNCGEQGGSMGKLREMRKTVLSALAAEPWPKGLERLESFPPKPLLGPLYACLLEPDQLIRWRAATAFGAAMSRLFLEKPEDARQVMRQLMWRLNEESGNIAWGIPEAFGETLASQAALAREYHRVLASYINERECETGDNYLEHCPLRRGVYWAVGRLAEAWPELARPALDDLCLALNGEDPESRGLAAWAVGSLLPLAGDKALRIRAQLEALTADPFSFDFYAQGRLALTSVGALARRALEIKS